MYVNVAENNIYTNTPAPSTNLQSVDDDYNNQCAYVLEHDLHLVLDDENPPNNHELVMNDNNSMYHHHQIPMPIVSPITPATTPMLIQLPRDDIGNQPNEFEAVKEVAKPEDDDNDFHYDDFDESCQSGGPTDRNNVDNAIDKKIEEFIANKGKKANPKICTVCNKIFRTNYKLRVHMETHEPTAKFTCSFDGCGKAFKSLIGMQEHAAAKHTGEYKYTCDVCQKRFLLRSYFMSHQKTHQLERTFACSLCSKTYRTKQNLIDHENCHLGVKQFKCSDCEQSFTTKNHLDVHHRMKHRQNDSVTCTVCQKSFKSRSYMKIHIKTHFEELKNYTCGVCSKNFIQMSDLKIHARLHTQEKLFICEICPKTFSRKDSLKLHSRSHSDEKHFFCGKCQRGFTRKYTMRKHSEQCTVGDDQSTATQAQSQSQ